MLGLNRSDLKTILTTTIIGAVIGAAYTQIAYLNRPDAQGSIWLGVGIGCSIGSLVSFFEIALVGQPNSWIRQLPFLVSLLVRAVIHLGLVYFSILAWQVIYQMLTGIPLVIIAGDPGDTMMDMGFSMAVVVMIIFYMQMRLFIGSRNLQNLIIGRYNKPRLEERIFMIVDVVGSTKLAQQLGDVDFHRYLNRVFSILDEPIHKNGGEVHSYVGDAIFAVWPVAANRKKNARPLRALAEMHQLLEKYGDRVEKKFGTIPKVRAAIHVGPVVAGETGHRKRQITYLGNTVNLAARIEALTKTGIGPYLASGSFLQTCELPNGVGVEALGEFDIKGSGTKIALARVGVDLQ